ncbi:signal peptidase complex subunit SPC2 NDAI_0D04720 [Naumovozyma dairenensis CBS 421]|uniref:Signal peptidase complex subunit 2 n=1 Tax=Naumovozyma dairenensis (strain ATCC 10597 / BCRC 20456 / CBS 421 / NBRC 0211 / NRRL Y-12639) TaxID=1071378 RepID=G0WAH4_NAUDC|nr:hypothetical protein NDAI_0D04720 [Naumovozyma dairenensis CBS 421]CCD24785.1 hypothetical protein NDAI_0D04720 [Naumovozyma dairenensis CBS 421]
MSKPVNVYSTPEVAKVLDEALPSVLETLNYKESFKLIDIKLIIGYSIAAVAGTSFLLDKKLGHKNVIAYQEILVACYFFLSALLWYFKKYIEKSVTYTGQHSQNGSKIAISTSYEEAEPKYYVTFVKNDTKDEEFKRVLETTKVFNEAGYLQTKLLHDWFQEQLDTIEIKKDN